MGVRTQLTELRNRVEGKTFEVWEEASGTITAFLNGNSVVTSETNSLTGMVEISSVPVLPKFTVALLGDSLTRNNQWTGSSYEPTINSQLGYWTFASQFLGKRFVYNASLNFGVFGDRTDQVLARVPQVLSTSANIVVELSGINDVLADVPAATIIANRLAIWAALHNAGRFVIAGTILPCSFTMNSARAKTLSAVNAWMRLNVPLMQGVKLWDSFFNLSDLTSSVAGCATNCYAADLLHLERKGAQIAGYDLAQTINTAFPTAAGVFSGVCAATGLSDFYDATNNPTGNLVSNPLLLGTAGTKAGAYATGNVADGWTVYRPTGSTIVCVGSKNVIALANGQTYAEQQLVVSTPGGGVAEEEISFQQGVTTAANDPFTGGCYFDVSAISGRLNFVESRSQIQYGAYSIICRDGFLSGGGANGLALSMLNSALQTPSGVCPAGGTVTNTSVVVGLDCTVAGSVTVKIRLPYARKL